MKLKPPKFLRRIMPELIWEMPVSQDLYLTFDDGPTPGVTEWILHTLKRADAKATFFVLGKNVELYPDLYERILRDGHKIGNHTYSHQKGWRMSLERYAEDIDFANSLVNSNLFRPPYGQITPSQSRYIAKRYKIVMWDILSLDYEQRISPRKCLRNVVNNMQGGSIVVFHDSEKSYRNMSYALPHVLRQAKKMGLECKSLEL